METNNDRLKKELIKEVDSLHLNHNITETISILRGKYNSGKVAGDYTGFYSKYKELGIDCIRSTAFCHMMNFTDIRSLYLDSLVEWTFGSYYKAMGFKDVDYFDEEPEAMKSLSNAKILIVDAEILGFTLEVISYIENALAGTGNNFNSDNIDILSSYEITKEFMPTTGKFFNDPKNITDKYDVIVGYVNTDKVKQKDSYSYDRTNLLDKINIMTANVKPGGVISFFTDKNIIDKFGPHQFGKSAMPINPLDKMRLYMYFSLTDLDGYVFINKQPKPIYDALYLINEEDIEHSTFSLNFYDITFNKKYVGDNFKFEKSSLFKFLMQMNKPPIHLKKIKVNYDYDGIELFPNTNVKLVDGKLVVDGYIIEQDTYDIALLYAFYSSVYAQFYNKFTNKPLYSLGFPEKTNDRTMKNITNLYKLLFKIYTSPNSRGDGETYCLITGLIGKLFIKSYRTTEGTDLMEEEFNKVVEDLTAAYMDKDVLIMLDIEQILYNPFIQNRILSAEKIFSTIEDYSLIEKIAGGN